MLAVLAIPLLAFCFLQCVVDDCDCGEGGKKGGHDHNGNDEGKGGKKGGNDDDYSYGNDDDGGKGEKGGKKGGHKNDEDDYHDNDYVLSSFFFIVLAEIVSKINHSYI